MKDIYENFDQLSKYEIRGADFEIEYEFRKSEILVVAPHGGRIEPFTGTLVKQIAGNDFSYYVFKGIKRKGNRVLHITSQHFDEPIALEAVGRAETVIAVHGARNKDCAWVMAGGLETGSGRQIERNLRDAGFTVNPPAIGMRGHHPLNICNRGRSRKGVQLELSRKLREIMMGDHEVSRRFVDAIRKVLPVPKSPC